MQNQDAGSTLVEAPRLEADDDMRLHLTILDRFRISVGRNDHPREIRGHARVMICPRAHGIVDLSDRHLRS